MPRPPIFSVERHIILGKYPPEALRTLGSTVGFEKGNWIGATKKSRKSARPALMEEPDCFSGAESNYAKSIATPPSKQSSGIYEALNASSTVARFCNNIGIVYNSRATPSRAPSTSSNARKSREKLVTKRLESQRIISVTFIPDQKITMQASTEYYTNAKNLFDRHADQRGLGRICTIIPGLYQWKRKTLEKLLEQFCFGVVARSYSSGRQVWRSDKSMLSIGEVLLR